MTTHSLSDKSTWEWSDNAALVIADYLMHSDGYGLGADGVNWTNIAVEADICDQTVTTVGGETIARWRIWGSYSLASDERRQVLADMLKACDGFCWQDADGKANIRVGRYTVPSVTITDDHILSIVGTIGPKAQERVNAVKVVYTEAAIGYREQESNTVAVPDALDDPNTGPQRVDIYFAPHHNQAVRLGKLALARLGDRWNIVVRTNLFGLNLIGERMCRLQSDELGVDADFQIDALRLDLANGAVEAVIVEALPDDWDFDAATEEGSPPSVPDPGSATVTIEGVAGLALATEQVNLGTSFGASIVATWDATARPDLVFDAQYRPAAGGDWVAMAVDSAGRSARSGVISTNIEYDVRVRSRTYAGRSSDWTGTATITPSADNSVPGPPSDLIATGGAGAADISLRLPVQPALAYARLYGSSSSGFGTAIQIGSDVVGALGEVISMSDTGLSAGTRYYWARAFNAEGDPSLLAGPVTATVS